MLCYRQPLFVLRTVDDSELGLTVLSQLYALGNSTRNFLYRHGLLWPTPLPSPVISIGNLTNGGTGKTPFVEYLARSYLQGHRFPSLILQRGRGNVDETVMLRHLFDDLPIVVTDSAEKASVAKEYLHAHPNVRLVLLDDGLQHLPLVRDLEVVMVNSLSPLGNGHLFPRGSLLEPPKAALRRADAVVLHHADLAGPERMEALQRQLASLAPRHTLFMQTAMAPLSLRSLICHPDIMRTSLDQSVSAGMGEHVPLSMLQGAAVVCLVGIGHPKTVENHLRRLGASHIEGCGANEDHHMFSLEEVQDAIQRVKELQAGGKYRHACIVMTEKDYARQFDLYDAVFSSFAAENSTWQDSEHATETWEGWGHEALLEPHQQQQQHLEQQQLHEQQEGANRALRFHAHAAEVGQSSPLRGDGGSSSSGNDNDGSSIRTQVSDEPSRDRVVDSTYGEGYESPADYASPCSPSSSSSSSSSGGSRLGGGIWGAYVLQSGLQVVEHDRRFSSQNAVLAAMLRMAVDNFRRRSYISS
ncbi:hypothetical protein N2152v2_005273 [Parachlorella kessleri]